MPCLRSIVPGRRVQPCKAPYEPEQEKEEWVAVGEALRRVRGVNARAPTVADIRSDVSMSRVTATLQGGLQNIDQYDTDGDGQLDADEQRRMLADMDLSAEENDAMMATLREADTDGDGVIDARELQRLKKEKKAARRQWLCTCCSVTLLMVWTLNTTDTPHNYVERLEVAAEGIPGLDLDNFSCDDPCPYAHDGECDVSYGLIDPLGYDECSPNTDWLDCDPCAYREDGRCDTLEGSVLREYATQSPTAP